MVTGIVGAASGLLGGWLGSKSRNKKLRKQMEMLNQQKAENQNWYDRRYNEDATQRADAVAALTRMQEMLRERNRQAAGTSAVAGGTDEALAMQKAAGTQALADATSQIAQAGAQRKDAIEGQYRERQQQLDSALMGAEAQKANAYDYASNMVGGAVDGFTKGYNILDRLKGE